MKDRRRSHLNTWALAKFTLFLGAYIRTSSFCKHTSLNSIPKIPKLKMTVITLMKKKLKKQICKHTSTPPPLLPHRQLQTLILPHLARSFSPSPFFSI